MTEAPLRGAVTVEMMLFPGMWFSHSGLVNSIEFVIQPLKKATRVHFKIFRPYCIPSLYLIPPGCEWLRTPFATCDTQPLCNTTGGCNNGHQWCHLQEMCLPITSPCSSYAFENITTNILPIANPPRYKGTQPYYSQVADIAMIISPDLNIVHVNVMLGDQEVRVYPDDVIGFQHDAGPNSLLHCLPSSISPWRQSYISLVRQGWLESLLVGFQPTWPSPRWFDNVVCDVRILYTDQPQPIAPTHSLTTVPDTFLETPVNRVSPTGIKCCPWTTITGLQIIYPWPHNGTLLVPTGNEILIVIKINSGSNASSWWSPPVRQSGVFFDAHCPSSLPQYTPACHRETSDTWFSYAHFTVTHPRIEILNITVSNEVSSQNMSVEIQAFDVIQGLQIMPRKPRRMLVDVSQIFSAQITHGTSVNFTWVIDNLALFAYSGQIYKVIFKRPATYRLKLMAVNPVSKQSIETELVADTMHPLTDPQFIRLSSMLLVDTPHKFTFRITVDSLAEVTFRWSFGDASTTIIHSKCPPHNAYLSEPDPRTMTVIVQDQMTWAYSQPGNYILEVECIAQWSRIRQSHSLYVRSPLTELSCAQMPEHPHTNGVVVFEAYPRPNSDGIFYTWNFGDGAPVVVVTSSTVQHRFKMRGIYNVTLQVNNTVSAMSSYLMVTVEEEITCLKVTTSERSELGSTISVHAEARSGTNILWAFSMGDGHTFGNLTTDTISYKYPVEGSYTITVTGRNMVSSASQSVVVEVHALKVLAVRPTGYLASGSNTSFQVQVSSTGNETRYRWSFGDGSPALVVRGSSGAYHTYTMTGNYTITITATSPFNTASYQAAIYVQAPIHSVQLLARNPYVQLKDPVQFVAKVDPEEGEQHPYQYHWNFGVPGPPISGCREQTFVYDKVGIYLAAVTVSNHVDHQSSSCSVTVQESVGDFTIRHEGLAQEALSLNKTYVFHLHGASGTNATFHWDFGDGTTRTQGQQISHIYWTCGRFTVTVVGVNLVSHLERFLNIHVITPISQLNVSADQLAVETGKSVVFTASLSAGEQVVFFWAVCGDCVLHHGSSSFKHSFLEPGTYRVVVTARNEVSEETKMVTVQAEEKIQDVTINTGDLIHGNYFAAKEICILRAHVALGSNVSYEWTIRQGQVVVAVGQGSVMMFQPEVAGDYWLVVLAKNAIGEVSQSEEISVLERISGVKVTSTPCNVATGQPVQLSITVTSGTDLLYEWFIEGAENHLRTSISSLSYVYSTAGITMVNVTVHNRLGNAQSSLVLTIQEPISEVSYNVRSAAPPFYLQTNAITHLKGFAGRGTAIFWEWCLLSPVGTQSWHGREINHTFSSAGVYQLTLNASNGVSWQSVHHNLTVQDSVTGLVIEMDKTIVRVGEPVTFTLRVQQGSMVRYFLNFTTLRTQLSLHEDTYKVAFPSVGQQNVTATARNEVSSETRSASLEVLEEVTGLYLVNCCQSAVEANQAMMLTARVRTGTGVMYRWHLHLPGLPDQHGSGSSIIYTPQSTGKLTVHVEAIGQFGALSLTECTQVQLPVSVVDKLWSDNVDPFVEQAVTFQVVLVGGTDVGYLWNFGDSPETYTSQNGTIQHRYKTAGWYTVEAKAFNDISSAVVHLAILVRQPACWAPEVRLVKPPPTIIRARASYFEAKVDLRGCTAYQAHYHWELFEGTRCHGSAGVHLSTVDTGKPILALPKLALPLGAHCLQFTVDFVSTPLSQKVTAVIQVVQSKLLAIINGGSERTWANHQDLVLDGSKSYDPDVEKEEEAFLSYRWACEAEDQFTSPCIQPGISVGPVVTIPRNTLLPGATYLFTLTVTKPGKEAAHTTQLVLVQAANIPCVMLECISCQVLWSYRVSRSTHVTLAGRCQNCSNKSTYKWTVQSSDASPLTLDNKTTSTGDSNPNLVVRQDVLQDGVNYTFTLSITDSEKQNTGFSSITLTPNYPPSRGECTIHPDQTLYLLETLLSFNCTGWWDEDDGQDQLVYSLMVMTCPHDFSSCDRFQLYRGIKPSSRVLLPAASSGRASTVHVLVQVEDLLGARTVAVNRTLTVWMPDFFLGSYSVIDWLRHKSQSELWGLVQQGDPSEVIPYSVTLITALNQCSRHREQDLKDRITIRSNITRALISLTVTTLEDVSQISAALAQCATFPEEFIMGQGLEGSLRMTRQMIDIIGNQTVQGSATPSETGRNILKILGAAMAAIEVSPNNRIQREDDLVTSATIFQLTSKLVQSLMRSRVFNEEPLLISVSEIDVQGKRVDPFNLLCSWPGEKCLFHIPPALSSQLSANRELIQLTMSLRVNPFPGGTISNYSVSTHLGSMELSSPQGLPLSISDLAAERSIRVTLADRRPRQLEHAETVRTLSPGESVNFTIRPVNSNRAAGLHIGLRFTLIDLEGAQDPDPFVRLHVNNNPQFNGSLDNATRGIILYPTRERLSVEHTIFLSPEMYDSTTEQLFVTVSNCFSSARVGITITTYTSLCQYFDFQSLQWRTEGIVPTQWTRLEEAVCLTRHLTVFGASLFVSPNAVEFLAPADRPVQNMVVAISCMLVFAVYVVMVLIAHKLDYIDINRVGIIPLCGQHGHYKYEVMVKTGWCRNAGTTAHVGISLYGLNKSGSRHLDKEGAFQRNSLDIFQIETDANLGEIWKIRIWHDNTGLSPSWHLEHVAVWDKQTDIMYYFLAQDWLSVENEKNEGMVEKDVLAACILKSPRKWMFPHSTLYVTYILCFLLIAVCVSVTVSYGMLFPNHVVLMWLISAFFSFLTSFFVLEPIKVLCEAVILALFTKPVDADEDDNLVEEPLVKKTSERIGKVRAPYGYSLLQAKEEARKVRALHTLMKNCVVHTIFLLVVLIVNYQGCYQSANGHLLRASIRQSIVGRTLHSSNFSTIQRPADFWRWLSTVLLPLLYNNPQLTLLGVLQLQHVRSQEGHCPWWVYRLTPGINPGNSCDHSNSSSTETITHGIGWSADFNSTNHSWAYSSDGFTGTQSVFVEFTQYSRDVDLYAVVTLRVVFQPAVPVKPTVNIKLFSVLSSSRAVDLLLVLMVLLFLFGLCFLVVEAIALNREGLAYFKEGQRYLQLLIILLCVLIPSFHFSHIRLADQQLSHYKNNPHHFVSFYYVACLAEGVTSLAAFLLTVLTLKIVGQFRFVRRWCVFGKTFQYMIRELMAAFLYLFLLVMVYAQCGYVMFSPALEHFVTFSSSLLALVAFPHGTLSLRHAVHHYPIIAPLYFISYLLCLMWIARNLFSAIINQSYRELKADMYRPAIEPQDYEMIEFFIKRFKLWIGLTKTKEFRHKVKFEGMESLPTGTSQTLRLSQLASENTESPFSDCTILSGSVQSEELTLPQSPTSETYNIEAYLDRLLPTVNSLLGQFDRVNKVTDDLYQIESDLEKVQHRIKRRRQILGRDEKSKIERQSLPVPTTQPRACSAVSDSVVSGLRPSTGPACEYCAGIAQSAHSALPVDPRSSDAPGRRAWQLGPSLSAVISQRAVWSSEPAAKPRPKSEEGQDRVMSQQQAPVKRRAWQSESMEGQP
ncbi:polycystin-1 [Chiloscyllium plagiosum]|uniref:polycystin-1 n=1 Tax=Chiloscyllium plagiosum TaxID=36176 RepID=UPI001CB810EA|nr:polycystin-1 [Chiloscyllium plagiosum]